jgi:nucleotide-binding universal stress UspA family protein
VYDTILYPTDGSEGAVAALDHAVDLAESHDATLDVLYADDGDEAVPEDVLDPARRAADDAGLDVNTVTLSGQPHDVIVEYVRDRGVDAVVMATHGRSGLERYILGSVTEKVLRSVDVPVLVVPLAASESPDE